MTKLLNTFHPQGFDKKPRTKKDMIAYLLAHYRYDTASSVNAATSYAANVKLHRLNFPTAAAKENAYSLIGDEDAMEEASEILREFDVRHGFRWQTGFNGRSGGYIVLYEGERKRSEHKSSCRFCGQRNFKVAAEGDNKCGKCGKDGRVNRDFYDLSVFTYRGVDMGTDFSDWDTENLRERVDVVWDFDNTVARAAQSFTDFCVDHRGEDQEVEVTRVETRRVAVPV